VFNYQKKRKTIFHPSFSSNYKFNIVMTIKCSMPITIIFPVATKLENLRYFEIISLVRKHGRKLAYNLIEILDHLKRITTDWDLL